MYVFQLFDYYSGNKMIMVIAFLECITVAYFYGKTSQLFYHDLTHTYISRCTTLLWQPHSHDWISYSALHESCVVIHHSDLHTGELRISIKISWLWFNALFIGDFWHQHSRVQWAKVQPCVHLPTMGNCIGLDDGQQFNLHGSHRGRYQYTAWNG